MGQPAEPAGFHLEALPPALLRALMQVGHIADVRGFYMAGGTALAVHLGHRVSADLDWFTRDALDDPMALAGRINEAGSRVAVRSTAPGTLHADVAGTLVSFLEYRYPLVAPLVAWPAYRCHLASIDDIACMKLAAVAQRGAKKDFVDLFALLESGRSLRMLLDLYKRKYRVTDLAHLLVALTYFEDAEQTKMPRMLRKVSWVTVKTTVTAAVRQTSSLR